ncbi:DUF3300 domain-containing protein [Serratia marcescens]|uniref:Protein of uncharacterized function (DUF3300) n=2 Tax=Serratia marcescens TaxID=615 RepID=A0A380A5W8_SERMA|nr:DUF3300 domain-containing protein [Serratia marcescens]KFD11857.1 putative exported protein [Serratia marcescens subsp. marcescens ATCC 13880]KFL03328.1 hypothetical protein DP21_3774 [Serratia marcescens]MCC3249664.1 DUF3300 domain-containing protein [Serratia marcescens]PNU45927.1 DUF3300 domain-containing protein [Serratia marcescens subsp. marcescens ATCC 13880]QDL85362.1 DUF3300 domain-containing protein [Serratia marcescens subsp. marcescens ATCC 13880]
MFTPRYLSWLLCAAMLPLSGCDRQKVADAMGASAPPSAASAANVSAPAYTPLTADQLYQLVSPVALFPDKLLAQVLAGAGYPDQISAADAWLAQNRGLQPAALSSAADTQPWDPSVRGLVQFPDVLDQMAKNIPWTTALGSASLNDPTDVMNAIQVMRQRAASQGTLKNTPQQRIVVAPTTRYVERQPYRQRVVAAPGETIVIEPSQPDTVYVPHYDPWVAYGTPVPAYPSYRYQPSGYSGGDMLAAGVISFGVGIAVASLFNQHNSGWHNWDMRWDDRRQPVVYRDAPYVSHSTTVVNRVTNINQYNNVNNVNRSIHTVNNYNNTTAAPTPHFNPQTPNAQPRVAPAAHAPMTLPTFAHSQPVAAAPHVQQSVNAPHVQQPRSMPTFTHTAPAAPHAQEPMAVHAAPVHPSAVHPQVQIVPHVVQPGAREPAATLHPALVRPAPVPQARIMPHPAPAPQIHQPSVQPMPHRQAPAPVKPQEHRPIVEQHKVG